MKITVIITTTILTALIALTGGYSFAETILIALAALGAVTALALGWHMLEKLRLEAADREAIRESFLNEVRAKEKELFKRDRKVKDTKTIKKIAKK